MMRRLAKITPSCSLASLGSSSALSALRSSSSSAPPAASPIPALGPFTGAKNVYTSRTPSITPLLAEDEASLHCFMMKCALSHPPASPAFICSVTGRTVTYGDIPKLVDQYAAVLYHHFGVRHGDVVVLMSPNSPEYVAIFHAVLALGAIVSPVNPVFTPTDVSRQAQLSKAKLLIALSVFEQTARDAVGLVEAAKGELELYFFDKAHHGAVDPVPKSYHFKSHANDTIVLPFSSGTTGLPKGVQLTNRNLVANILQTQVSTGCSARDVLLSVLPFFHIYGLTVLMHGGIHMGSKQIVFPRFDMVSYLNHLQEHRATMLFVAPPMMVGFAKHPAVRQTDTSSVEFIMSGAAPLAEELQRMCEPLFPNAVVGQGYGLSETSPVVSLVGRNEKQGAKHRYGTSGHLAADTEARIVIVEESGAYRDAKTGEEGELWVKGPQIMKGYLQQHDTDIILPREEKGEWLRTGDLCKFDEDGYMTVTDRVKELIKYKGCQVAPAELEGLLQQHPDVLDAIVVGVESPCGSGEVPVARVVLKPGVAEDAATLGAIQSFVDTKVRPQQRLRFGVHAAKEIPKTASGKLLRRIVRDEVRQMHRDGKLRSHTTDDHSKTPASTHHASHHSTHDHQHHHTTPHHKGH